MSKEKIDSLCTAGALSMVVGSMCSVFIPNPLYAYALYVAGSGALACHFLDKLDSKYSNLFKNLGLQNKDGEYPIKLSHKKTDYGYELRFALPVGICIEEFKKQQDALEVFFKHRVVIMYDNKKNVILQVYENELRKIYPYDESIKTKPYEIPLGYTHGEKLVTLNIKKAIHILVGGETGGGKSSVLRLLLTFLVTKTDATIHLIDLKGGVEGRLFAPYISTFAKDLDSAEKLIYKIKTEVERRYELLYRWDCIDIEEFNHKNKNNPLSREFLIIDEFSVLSNDRDTKDLIKEVENIAALARACGIHLIICLQRCDSKILSPRIKANMPTVIGLKTRDDVNSRIIGIKGLEKLSGNGHAIMQFEGKDTELQCVYIDAATTRNLLRKKFKKKEDQGAVFVAKQNNKVDDFNMDIFKED